MAPGLAAGCAAQRPPLQHIRASCSKLSLAGCSDWLRWNNMGTCWLAGWLAGAPGEISFLAKGCEEGVQQGPTCKLPSSSPILSSSACLAPPRLAASAARASSARSSPRSGAVPLAALARCASSFCSSAVTWGPRAHAGEAGAGAWNGELEQGDLGRWRELCQRPQALHARPDACCASMQHESAAAWVGQRPALRPTCGMRCCTSSSCLATFLDSRWCSCSLARRSCGGGRGGRLPGVQHDSVQIICGSTGRCCGSGAEVRVAG